ncbi:MAG: hypothetical protein QOJ73_103 [Streptosporangiaceae bacterium]|nr:hypothetical protein [Streptosporangiaceae bacterium]
MWKGGVCDASARCGLSAPCPDHILPEEMIDQLRGRYQAVCDTAGVPAAEADMTVVFDAGQNSEANFAHLAGGGLHYIGSVPASDCPDLTACQQAIRRR